jgi:cytochrome oxidase Cu insertion factor (SCO1/SenC/PrrC family)
VSPAPRVRAGHSGPRRPGLRRLLAAAATAVAVGLLGAGCASPAGPGGGSRRPASLSDNPAVDPGSPLGDRPAPGFTLTDQFGRRVSLSQFRGRAVLLAFVDTRCTTICPLTTESMARAGQLLGPAARELALVGVNANPRATAVSNVRAYSRAHRMTHLWQFLTGPLPALGRVWRAYHVYVQASHGQIDHEPAVYLIDPRGREERLFSTQMAYTAVEQQAEVLARAVSSVLPGHPRVGHPVSLAYQPGIPPSRPVTLPVVAGAAGSGRVTLGAGNAHLVVFFASWVAEVSDLPAELLALNRYQRLARRRGWPSVVAVDEQPTEPGGWALRAALAPLAGRLRYPVTVDRTGALADGYGVQDEPWVTLTSRSGHVLLRNDGWFPARLLPGAVARALRTAAGG